LILPARWLAWLLLCCAWHSHATSAAELKALAEHPTWLKLGHYRPDGSGWRSAIHDSSFFLDGSGSVDPHAELAASLSAFASAEGAGTDGHAQCRYPARWTWLRERLGTDVPGLREPMRCPGFDAFTRGRSVSSVSVVFATGFLANPASFYGHTLLKFNFRGERGQSRLLDLSVNYGAIVGNDEGILTYVLKSLLGGYDGGFSHINFYFHNHNYGDLELRDLWEYQLRLPQQASDLIVAHAWEVLGKRYTYYFFRENCAYRMAELLEVAEGVDAIPRAWPWIIPQALVGHMGAARYRGEPLIGEVTYHPSRQSRYYAKYAQLAAPQADALRVFVEGAPPERDRALDRLDPRQRAAVLDTALDYYQYIGAPIDRAPKPLREQYTQALAKRYQLPPADAAPAPVPEPISPHRSRGLGWVQVSAARDSDSREAIGLRIRPAYYDALDSESGQVGNSLLAMGNLQLSVRRGRLKLRRLDLLGIESANPGRTPLPGDGGAAYKLHFGIEPLGAEHDAGHALRLQGDYGRGKVIAPGLFVAGYVGGALQTCRNDRCPGFVRATLDLVYRPREDLGLRVSVERRAPVGGSPSPTTEAAVEARWRVTADTDVRVSFDRARGHRAALGVGRYW
jgi:Domain of unknown function (DUF4105)